jgi:GNAT superfamily N-acetyltransferase
MTIRRASAEDATVLAEHRAAVWREVGEWDSAELEPQIVIWAAYFSRQIAGGTYVAYVAEENGAPIASGAILIHAAIPRPNLDSDRAGRVQSVYVTPTARRNGVARAVMTHLLRFAEEANLISLSLHPSDEARDLYASLGFESVDEMLLRPA